MSDFVKVPCKHCPFRNDVTPYLHPDRATEIAYVASNPYSSFPCHKTTEYNEETDELEETNASKQCAGMLTMRAQAGERTPKGFEPAWELCYIDEWEMIQAYEDEWNKQHKKTKK